MFRSAKTWSSDARYPSTTGRTRRFNCGGSSRGIRCRRARRRDVPAMLWAGSVGDKPFQAAQRFEFRGRLECGDRGVRRDLLDQPRLAKPFSVDPEAVTVSAQAARQHPGDPHRAARLRRPQRLGDRRPEHRHRRNTPLRRHLDPRQPDASRPAQRTSRCPRIPVRRLERFEIRWVKPKPPSPH